MLFGLSNTDQSMKPPAVNGKVVARVMLGIFWCDVSRSSSFGSVSLSKFSRGRLVFFVAEHLFSVFEHSFRFDTKPSFPRRKTIFVQTFSGTLQIRTAPSHVDARSASLKFPIWVRDFWHSGTQPLRPSVDASRSRRIACEDSGDSWRREVLTMAF